MRSDWPTPNVPYLPANEVCCAVREATMEDDIPNEEKALNSCAVAIMRIVDGSHPAVNEFGLFAAEPIAPHSFVCNYIGRVHLQTEFPDSDYAVTYFGEYAVDATVAGNEARFINDYRNIAERPNVAFDTYRDVDGKIQVGVWSLNKPIAAGEEILGNYGRAYWRARGVKGVIGPDWDDSWD